MLFPILISFSIRSNKIDKLESAYKRGSVSMTNKFIYKNRLRCKTNVNNDTSNRINSLLSEFVKVYSGEVNVDPHKFTNPNRPGNEKFIMMQPEIEVGFVNYNLDKSNSYSFERSKPNSRFFDVNRYSFKGVYRNFTSSAYLALDGIVSQKRRSYCVDNTKKYQVIRVDTSVIKTVQNFLKKSGIEHKERADFIHKSVNLVKTRMVDQDPVGGKFHYMAFNYNFYIERIVFDKNLNNAWIQFSFYTQSSEATFSKEGDKWKLKKSKASIHLVIPFNHVLIDRTIY